MKHTPNESRIKLVCLALGLTREEFTKRAEKLLLLYCSMDNKVKEYYNIVTVYRVMQGNEKGEEVPARYPECNVNPTWKTHEYKTFYQAQAYACDWLGAYGPEDPRNMQVDIKWRYGMGDSYIVIREVEINERKN